MKIVGYDTKCLESKAQWQAHMEAKELFLYQADLPAPSSGMNDRLSALFAEELGLVIEVAAEKEKGVAEAYAAAGLKVACIGKVTERPSVRISVAGQPGISGKQLSSKSQAVGTEKLMRSMIAIGLSATMYRDWQAYLTPEVNRVKGSRVSLK